MKNLVTQTTSTRPLVSGIIKTSVLAFLVAGLVGCGPTTVPADPTPPAADYDAPVDIPEGE